MRRQAAVPLLLVFLAVALWARWQSRLEFHLTVRSEGLGFSHFEFWFCQAVDGTGRYDACMTWLEQSRTRAAKRHGILNKVESDQFVRWLEDREVWATRSIYSDISKAQVEFDIRRGLLQHSFVVSPQGCGCFPQAVWFDFFEKGDRSLPGVLLQECLNEACLRELPAE